MISSMVQPQYNVTYHRHRALNTGDTGGELKRIKEMYYGFVFIEFPVAVKHILKEDLFRTCAIICSWARACSDNAIPFMLFAAEGRKWSEPQISAMIDAKLLRKSWHRACHFGIKIDDASKNLRVRAG